MKVLILSSRPRYSYKKTENLRPSADGTASAGEKPSGVAFVLIERNPPNNSFGWAGGAARIIYDQKVGYRPGTNQGGSTVEL
jgi:hypothetical protein